MSKLFAELKRRKVVRVAGVYAVVAWLLIQVADNIVPALQLPDWTNTLIVLLLLLGFPIALVLAWAFEVTPAGVQREGSGLESAAHGSPGGQVSATGSTIDRKFIYATFALVLLVAMFQIGDRLLFNESPATNSNSPQNTASVLGGPTPLARFDLTPTASLQLVSSPFGIDFALSPDGSRIVYIGPAPDGGTQLWQRALDDLEAVPIRGTEGAINPAMSPDGQSVAFFDSGSIRTVSLAGGPAVTVAGSGNAFSSPAWGADGRLYFTRDNMLYRVAATGGEPEPVTVPAENSEHRFPEPLPEERGLLLTVFRGSDSTSRIAVVGPEGGAVREILTGTMARYAASGHIVYTTADGSLLAAPFDVQRLELTGPSVALVEGVQIKFLGAAQFALSGSGTLLYSTGTAGRLSELVWVNRAGEAEAVDPAWTGVLSSPALSPDGSRLAVTLQEQGQGSINVWVKQLDRGPALKLTLEGDRNDYPGWTPDGSSVSFFSDLAGPSFDLWTKRADGSAQAALQLDLARPLAESLWSPDGEWLVVRTATTEAHGVDILALRPGVDSEPVPLVATAFDELAPTLSPDGRWLAYSSDETGRLEIYVVPFPNAAEARWAVSVGGGSEPLWSPGGSELFYRNGQGDMVAVPVQTTPTFSPGTPSVLFPAADYGAFEFHRQYDVSADGERFLMLRPAVGTVGDSQGRLILVQNFFEELRRLEAAP